MATDTVEVLNELIRTCNDGQKGFKTAADDVSRMDLRDILLAGAARCRDAASELTVMVQTLGGDPASGGSVVGALHRGWVEVKSAVTGHSDLAILEECERGEDSAERSYKAALDADFLTADVRMIIQRQYQGVAQNHDRVRALRDSLK